jgi:hypothetical protein
MPTTDVIGAGRTKDETEKTQKTQSTFSSVSFPSNLESDNKHKNYLIFRVVNQEKANLTHETLKETQNSFMTNPGNVQNTLALIRMYMPNLNESLSHDYAQSNTTVWAEMATKFIDANTATEGSMDAAKAAWDRIIQTLQNNDTMTQVNGTRQLQNHVSLWKGTQLRQQTFHFTLRPRNLDELKSVGEIIHNFRLYSSGTMTKTVAGTDGAIGTVRVPPMWFIEERIKRAYKKTVGEGPPEPAAQNRYIDKFMMGPCTITNVRINKTPDQVYQSIAETAGDPVSIDLEITFQEMIPTYSNYWEQLRSSLGNVITEGAA